MEDGNLNLAGLLFFGKSPQGFKPIFHVKAVSFTGNDIAETGYWDSINTEGEVETLTLFAGGASMIMNFAFCAYLRPLLIASSLI